MGSSTKVAGKVIAVAVDERAGSQAAFAAALSAVTPEDRLLIIFARPLKTGSSFYEFTTKAMHALYDKRAKEALDKYSDLATKAQINYEAVEVEGAHLREAILLECSFACADVLYEPHRTIWEKLTNDRYGYNYCEKCNAFFRGSGRILAVQRCHLPLTENPPCEVIKVKSSTRQNTSAPTRVTPAARGFVFVY